MGHQAPSRRGARELKRVAGRPARADSTLVDMTVFPALTRNGVPLPNAPRRGTVQRGLIEPVISRPTERLQRLDPGLRAPDGPA